LAICPEGAISVNGMRPENSLAIVPQALPQFEQMNLLVRARRSVRQYRDEDVEPNLIQRLLDALAHSPTGVNARRLAFTVVSQRTVLSELRARTLEAIAVAAKQGTLPPKVSFLGKAPQIWQKDGRDLIFRNAPHVLIVSAPPNTPCPQQDVALTLAYFELLAQSAGLGTVWCGYLRVVFDALPSLKALVSLEPDHVYYAMLFGVPAVSYARTVQREGSAQIRRVTRI
jgi:nitroreductase